MKNIKKIIISIIFCSISLFAFAQDKYSVFNIEYANSPNLDFSPVPFQKGFIFTSTRDNNCKCKDKKSDDNFSDLYYADDMAATVKALEGDLNGKHHDGVATTSTNGNTMYITRTNKKGKNKAGVKDNKIYKLINENGVWVADGAFPFNNNEFSTAHPSLSANGRQLYFSSNRTGSIGGMDIWVSEKDDKGNWGEPRNLGAPINTAGNEIFPFISVKNELYFTSDAQKGAKKLDIFKADKTFKKVERLPAPINTEDDDFGFSLVNDGKRGFLSSNRLGGKGGDDVYAWNENEIPMPMCFVSVIDAATTNQIEKPLTTITYEGGVPMIFNDDVVSFVPNPDLIYTIKVVKPNYETKTTTVKGSELLAVPEYKVPLVQPAQVVEKEQPVKILVKSKPTQALLPSSEVSVEKICEGKTVTQQTNSNGEINMTAACNCNLRVTARKADYSTTTSTFMVGLCDPNQPSVITIELEPLPKAATPVRTFEGAELKQGAIITLKDIYYDYDKYYIRPDAAKVLDKVVNLMKQYPSLELELGSHTDCRGRNEYNQSLSQNRAESAVKYIISKGIAANRLSAAGYGETRLKNECADGVKCSETQHQENRRTEIRVTRFDETNVEIRKEK
jgi:outer membrane protein OmpA-like peptidoglycan-associated protein